MHEAPVLLRREEVAMTNNACKAENLSCYFPYFTSTKFIISSGIAQSPHLHATGVREETVVVVAAGFTACTATPKRLKGHRERFFGHSRKEVRVERSKNSIRRGICFT